MRTIQKSLFIASLLLATTAASAQKVITQDLGTWMSSLISRAIDNNVEVSKSFGQERDIQKEGTPLKWRCDIMTFTLPKKQRPLLDEMIKAFEANGHDNPLCYGINTLTTGNPQNEGKRNLIIGDDINRYVTIGEQYGNYVNVNILDANDTTKTHRYAYALEWREQSGTSEKGAIEVRYIVTYAKIPSAMPTVSRIINYNGSVKPFKYFEDNLDVQKRYEEFIKGIDPKDLQRLGNVRITDKLSVSGDSIFVVKGTEEPAWNLVEGVLPMMERGNYLLMFSNLKQYYQNHKNAELTAISIYSLCKQAVEDGYFTDNSVQELEQVICDVDKLTEEAKTETDRKYFQMAREQLDKILKSRK